MEQIAETTRQTYEGWDEFYAKAVDEKLDFFKIKGRIFDVIYAQQFDREFLDELCDLAEKIRLLAKTKMGARKLSNLLPHKRAMLYFVQPSTRTFLSFQNACFLLGLNVSESRGTSTSSEVKGESPEDTIRTFASYVDLIISRHPEAGFAEKTSWVLNQTERPVPVLNGGSGPDQHPTQALLDIYTLQREFQAIGGLDGKKIAMVGDLKRGRTVRSLSYLLKNYEGVTIYSTGDESDSLYIINRGTVAVIHENPEASKYWYTAFAVSMVGNVVSLGSRLECDSFTTASVDPINIASALGSLFSGCPDF